MSKAIQDKRLTTELLRLQDLPEDYKVRTRQSPIGTHIHAEFPKSLINSTLKPEQIEKYIFEAFLDKRFPFVSPQIKCRTEFCEPSLADERDLTASIVGQEWHPALTVAEMMKLVPEFITRTLSDTKDGQGYTSMFGTFHLGHQYDVGVLRGLNSCVVFGCEELADGEVEAEQARRQRYISVSENIVLILDKEEETPNGGSSFAPLLTWGTLQSIDRIEPIEEVRGLVKIHWKTAERRDRELNLEAEEEEEEEKGEWVQHLFFEDPPLFVDLVKQKISKLGAGFELVQRRRIPEREVLRSAVIRKDIEPVLREIELIEGQVAGGNLVRERICFLMDLYQRAIEHFSAVSDTSHSEYLSKLREMLSREDVQRVMMEEAK